MNRLALRPANPADLSAIRNLLRQSTLPIDDVDEALLKHFLMAESEHGIAGVAGLQVFGFIGLLRSLVVSVAARGTGIGKALQDGIEAQARDCGVRELWLLTTDASDYFAANDYELCDRQSAPEVIRNTAEFSELCPADAHLMCKRLC